MYYSHITNFSELHLGKRLGNAHLSPSAAKPQASGGPR
jgi:hypothetical protein